MSLKSRNTEDNNKKLKRAIHMEDALILVSVVGLFFLGVFFQHKTWAQAILAVILVVMLAVFIRRTRRIKRALQDKDDE